MGYDSTVKLMLLAWKAFMVAFCAGILSKWLL